MLFLWIIFLQFFFAYLEAYHWDGNTMKDLEYQGSAFVSEAGPWTQSTYFTSGVKTSQCDGNTIMGGYQVLSLSSPKGQYWQRLYTGIPTPHNVVYLAIRIYPIDSWDYNEDDHFEVWLDSQKIIAWTLEGYDSPYANTNICGDPNYNDLKPMWMYATVPHTLNTLTFRVVNGIGYDEESLGFRDITMNFQQISNPPSSFSFCGVTQGNPLAYNACPCADGQYMTPSQSGNCANCDSSCVTCSGGGSSACLTCPDGRWKSGTTCPKCDSNCKTCSGAAITCLTCNTNWFMVGTTCYSTCNSLLYSEVSNGVTYCKTPCPGQYVYWDGSCGPTCGYSSAYETFSVTPSVESTYSRCDYPCVGTNKFLSWNNTCLSTCPEPLTALTYKSQKFCSFPCAGSTQYLYWDKSCRSTCPSPLLPEVQGSPMQRKFCWTPCQADQLLFSDGSCVNSCPLGYYKDLYFCEPCQDSLCSVCSSASSGKICQQCKDPYILNSNKICQDCQTLKSEFIKQDDEIFMYQYKLTLLPASCDLDEAAVKQYLLPTQDSKNQLPSFSFQVNQAQDSTGANYFLLEIQFASAISSDSLMTFALSSLKTDLSVPKTPRPPEPTQSLEPTQSTADSPVKSTFAAVTGSTVGAGLTLGATAALWSIINFQQFVGYFIYFNIQLPSHLIYFLTMFGNVNLEILPNPLSSITDRLAERWDSLVNNSDPKYQLPHKFAEFDTPTLFIINAGSTFFICIIILLMPFLFDLLRKFKPLGRIKFIQNLHSNLRWNIPIRIFLESGIPLTFALLVQVRKISYNNVPYGISTVTASLAFIYLGLMINYICQTLINFKYEDLKNPSVENSIGTLFEGLVLKKEKPSGKYYYLLILIRGMLLVSVGVLAEHFPVVQTVTMAVFNLFFVYFVWAVIKFESRYLNWTNRIKEVLILIVEILFVTLCYMKTEGYRNLVGWLIIGMLGLTLALELLFGFYLQILAVRDFVKWIREYRKKSKKVLVIAPVTIEETSRNFTIES